MAKVIKITVDGITITEEQAQDIISCAANVVKDTDEPAHEGEMGEALFAAGLISEDVYDSYMG